MSPAVPGNFINLNITLPLMQDKNEITEYFIILQVGAVQHKHFGWSHFNTQQLLYISFNY
jgi:hypothetical protein